MGEIAAHTVATKNHFGGRKIGASGTEAVFNVVVDPVADGLHARQAVRDLAELIPRKVHQLVRIAISARQRIAQQLMRQLSHGHQVSLDVPAVGHGRNGDEGIMPDFIAARHECRAIKKVAVTVLQGAKYSNLTTIRTSGDRFEPGKWRPFLYTSQLATALGIWPWCDVFKSGETGNMIVAVLSAGAVGTGDAMGKEAPGNIRLAARTDGVLVKPDRPMVPTDDAYLREARGTGGALSAWTCTDHGDHRTLYGFAF